MMAITLPRRRLWGNRHSRCEAPWDPLRPPVFFSPRSSVHAAWLVPQRERACGPIRGAINLRHRLGGVCDVVVLHRGLWRAGSAPRPCAGAAGRPWRVTACPERATPQGPPPGVWGADAFAWRRIGPSAPRYTASTRRTRPSGWLSSPGKPRLDGGRPRSRWSGTESE